MRTIFRVAIVSIIPACVHAQTPAPAAHYTDAQQITAAVLPLPGEFRADATVLGYHPGSTSLVPLRKGTGAFTCLAANPAAPNFHVACYHNSLDAFMERGRALRAQGVKGDQVDSARFKEIRGGTLRMPSQPAALYTLTGPAGSFDVESGTTKGARSLYVVYIPGATAASTGISARPAEGTPWIMFPGTPKAHIMFVPRM